MANFIPYSDHELLLMVAKGDEAAFQALLDRYAPLLFAYLNKLTFSRSLAEELVQDSFLKIWQTRETLSKIENFRGYLFTITRNQSINAVRKIIRERKLHQDWETYISAQPSPLEADREWQYSLIDEAIEQLPPQQKAVLIKSRKQGMKLDAIAQDMRLSKATVKKYLQRALDAILQYVQDHQLLLALCWFLNNF